MVVGEAVERLEFSFSTSFPEIDEEINKIQPKHNNLYMYFD
jgi:hypothetical protein